MNATLLIALILSPISAAAGWDLVVPDKENCGFTAHPKGFEIRGDFDGNGKKDLARLERNEAKNAFRIAAWMNGNQKPLVLKQGKGEIDGIFLDLAEPATVDAFNGVKEFRYKIALPSIAWGSCEASEQVFQWNKKKAKFIGTWIGD